MKQSVYLTWTKHQATARYNLVSSGILPCNLSDLPITLDDIVLNGSNSEGYGPLKEAIATRYGAHADSVVTVAGTSMANFLTFATILERGDEVLVEQPAYEPLLAALSYLGAEIKRFSRSFEHGYQPDVDQVGRLISPRTKLIVVTSPHNPSGIVIEQKRLHRIGELAASVGAYVLVDEVYRDILFEDAPPSAVHLGENFIATASLTKAYGLHGLRCGWILCAPELAEKVQRMKDLVDDTSSMPGDAIALAAFRQLDKLTARTRALLEQNYKLVASFLSEHQEFLDYVLPPRSTIVFPRLKHFDSSDGLHELLRTFETSIVPGKYFEEPRHFRLGFTVKPEDVATGLRNLSQALHQIHRSK